MKLRSPSIACCLLLSAVSILAQSGGAATDPISGTWTGDIGPNETTRYPITMKLKFDGKSAVSGTVSGSSPGEVKTGTFDPKTGALKLEVDIKDHSAVARSVFEGTVVNGAATGRVSGRNRTGDFKVKKD